MATKRKIIPKLPSFDVTIADARLINKIAQRAMYDLQAARHTDQFTKLDVAMDVTATHVNGNPLRLADLLVANGFNFAHDILGIRTHLDRDTGKLMNSFRPRFSQPGKE